MRYTASGDERAEVEGVSGAFLPDPQVDCGCVQKWMSVATSTRRKFVLIHTQRPFP